MEAWFWAGFAAAFFGAGFAAAFFGAGFAAGLAGAGAGLTAGAGLAAGAGAGLAAGADAGVAGLDDLAGCCSPQADRTITAQVSAAARMVLRIFWFSL
ncbi:MAG: hypothetical protein E7055_19690 [Lentisphaerae bacterium]|nr:hypothetical protein [Lentisphaerota bacterium]